MTSSAPQWPDEGLAHDRDAKGTSGQLRPVRQPAAPEAEQRTGLRLIPDGMPARTLPDRPVADRRPPGPIGFAAERDPTESDLAAARRRARPHLPPPAKMTRDVAMALLEVEAGCRSAAQLERICSPQLWLGLERRIGRRGGPLPNHRSLINVVCQEHTPGLADTVAVVQRGDRVLPVAMRLDARGGRWAVTELRWWRSETEADPTPCRDRGGGW
jgi:hypothetical protein